jgi:hypothetical protein
MTPEQIAKLSNMGYIVVNHGEIVMDIHKNVVVKKTANGIYTSHIPEVQEVFATPVDLEIHGPFDSAMDVLVRARDDNGKFIPDDPATPDVNEAWIKKAVKKVTRKK